MYTDQELIIRPILEQDMDRLWELIYKDEQPEWKKWDAPYYPHRAIPYEQFIETMHDWIGNTSMWVIEVSGVVRGLSPTTGNTNRQSGLKWASSCMRDNHGEKVLEHGH